MGRPPLHPSGAKKTISIQLSPEHLAKLDRLVAERGTSRAEFIAKVLDRLNDKK